MTDILQLLPCPFCGGRPRIDHTDGGGSFIECAKCGASSAVHYGRKENLIPSWNRRKLDADTYMRHLAEWHDTGHMKAGVQRIARAALEGKDD